MVEMVYVNTLGVSVKINTETMEEAIEELHIFIDGVFEENKQQKGN